MGHIPLTTASDAWLEHLDRDRRLAKTSLKTYGSTPARRIQGSACLPIGGRAAAVQLSYDLPELLLLVRRAAEQTPPTDFSAVRAHRLFLADATWAEIGRALGIAGDSAMRLQHRFRKRLRKTPEQWADAQLAEIRAELGQQPLPPTKPKPKFLERGLVAARSWDLIPQSVERTPGRIDKP